MGERIVIIGVIVLIALMGFVSGFMSSGALNPKPACRDLIVGVQVGPRQLVPEAITVCGIDLEFHRAPLGPEV